MAIIEKQMVANVGGDIQKRILSVSTTHHHKMNSKGFFWSSCFVLFCVSRSLLVCFDFHIYENFFVFYLRESERVKEGRRKHKKAG